MRLGAFKILLCSISLCLYCMSAYGDESLRQRQQSAQQDRKSLQAQIKELQQKIDAEQSKRDNVAKSMRESEEKISVISKTLHDYEQRLADLDVSLQKLKDSKRKQDILLDQQRKALAKQLKAQYASGLSSWTSILSGKDPQDISRDLSYLSYVLRSRVTTVDAVKETLEKLADLSEKIKLSQDDLLSLQKKAEHERDQLKTAQVQRNQELAKIKSALADKKARSNQLAADDKALSGLIKQLDVEIAKAAQKAKERRAALLREQAAKEKAAKEQAAKEQAAKEQAAKEQRARESQPVKPLLSEPEGGFPGLSKNLKPPVNGKVLGRFGAQRPDGGVWRGIVLQTKEGTAVHAVAAGKVVYASWLSGFGNLLIMDHGKGYLSIYGYNKSILKDVGDLVASGEVIAEVGSTGGQVEPGLYFELRKDSAPINPQLWLGP